MASLSSYDLMMFAPEAAPRDYNAFLAWFAEQMECDEGHAYNDSRKTSEKLRAWYREMLLVFPSGADEWEENSPGDYDEDHYSGYSIGQQFIYVIFEPLLAESARRTAFDLAAKHGLGLFEPSWAGAELWWPEAGKLVLLHRQPAPVQEAPSLWQRIMRKPNAAGFPKPRLPDWMS